MKIRYYLLAALAIIGSLGGWFYIEPYAYGICGFVVGLVAVAVTAIIAHDEHAPPGVLIIAPLAVGAVAAALWPGLLLVGGFWLSWSWATDEDVAYKSDQSGA